MDEIKPARHFNKLNPCGRRLQEVEFMCSKIQSLPQLPCLRTDPPDAQQPRAEGALALYLQCIFNHFFTIHGRPQLFWKGGGTVRFRPIQSVRCPRFQPIQLVGEVCCPLQPIQPVGGVHFITGGGGGAFSPEVVEPWPPPLPGGGPCTLIYRR